ncbi:MAG: metallophosphatase family protein, partial [Candidatus Omnitrophica bacterium]|nr:metallophosphatase family protein [Candidatus Omnitrophota bacterium]
MKFAIISDIHSNLEALEAVLSRIRNVDKIICLGDIVGYGPNPNECIDLIRNQENLVCIAGNHDKAAVGIMDMTNFNRNAKDAMLWTKITLTDENKEYLKALPLTLDIPEFQIVHGSLVNPLEEYITNLAEASPTLQKMEKPILFVGHSHAPLYIGQKEDGMIEGKKLKDKDSVDTKLFKKIIINVGSIGQPRDGDP